MRKLASIQKIEEIRPIEKADSLDHYRINGWWVVDRKGAHKVGDLVIYFEIDSFIPHEVAPFLSKGGIPKVYNGVRGNPIKTIKLRGALSQGLIMRIPDECKYMPNQQVSVGDDFTGILGVQKWEPQIPAALAGKARGKFPEWLRKTDEERIQNCFRDIDHLLDEDWVVEEKLDGSSMTVGKLGNDIHVCSRNLSLDLSGENNAFIKAANATNVLTALARHPMNLGISGELCGPGIQGNKYDLTKPTWFVFNIYLVDENRYATLQERFQILDELERLGFRYQGVPCIRRGKLGRSVDEILKEAEGKSIFNPKVDREGLVFKLAKDGDVSFKAISNKWLLKTGE
jgi:RNA ligase (TIGR02306 family)